MLLHEMVGLGWGFPETRLRGAAAAAGSLCGNHREQKSGAGGGRWGGKKEP